MRERDSFGKFVVGHTKIGGFIAGDMHDGVAKKRDGSIRFYAKFEGAMLTDGYFLIGSFGNGRTKEEAIKNYAKEISEQRMVVDSFKPTKREIEVPVLVGVKP